MDREARIKRFAQMQEKEGQSANRIQDILEQKKIEKKKRDRRRAIRKQLIRFVSRWVAVAVIVAVCIMGGMQVLRRFPVKDPASNAQLTIQMTESERETETETEKPETEQAVDSWLNMNGNTEQVYYGNTVLSTAGGISLDIASLAVPDWINVCFLTVNPYSRPCVAMNSIQYIAIHYVGNAGTTAAQNWSYFEGLKDSQITKASSHFIVGLEGEVISCIPLNEMSYCTNERNVDTISIEVCHPDPEGQFSEVTYQSVVNLTAWLCKTFALPVDHVIRHFDVTGKHCPKYYVENPEAWEQLRADIQAALDQM